jgi:hypothetical protein
MRLRQVFVMIKIPQPPILRDLRPAEDRKFWSGLLVSLAGLLLALFGLGRITDVETVQGGLAIEKEINMAFAHGGVKVTGLKPAPLPPPPDIGLPPGEDPNFPPIPPPILEPNNADVKLRIDPTATDPCPT